MTTFHRKIMSRLLAGTPALAALLIVALLLLATRPAHSPRMVDWYRQKANRSFDAGDYKTALVCYARVAQANPTDAVAAFSLFQCMEAVGQGDAAQSLLARLAPLDRRGFPPAQLLEADRLLQPRAPSPAAVDAAIEHLRQANSMAGDNPSAVALWAVACAQQNRWDDAQRAAEIAGRLRSSTLGRLADIAENKGEVQRAQQYRAEADR